MATLETFLARYGVPRHLAGALEDTGNRATELSDALEIEDLIGQLSPRDAGVSLIRIGGPGDGGYLVPDDLAGVTTCFSPGVNYTKAFEDALAQQYGIRSHMCDFSSGLHKLSTPLVDGLQFFEKLWLDLPGTPDSIDLDTWVARHSLPQEDLILQMDIEGAEYRNLLHVDPRTLRRFRILIFELHGLNDLQYRDFLKRIFEPAMRKILVDFIPVHAHPNNCCGAVALSDSIVVPRVLEMTFLRKDRVRRSAGSHSHRGVALPHAEDVANVPKNPPLHLTGLWLGHADRIQSELNGLRELNTWLKNKVANLESALSTYSDYIYEMLGSLAQSGQNLALGRPATQSSTYRASKALDQKGATSGQKSGRFGFHTCFERDPWWMVDLGAIHSIGCIAIFNRMDACQERAATLQILISTDQKKWRTVYDHYGKAPFGGIRPYHGSPPLALFFPFEGRPSARYIKLKCRGVTALHLDEVEIYDGINAGPSE